ncbi:C40 family peptidase [Rhodococcus sp. UNC23MFCrub1.1]|uniref:NlpC/P60 family protein n=1 Tax=Rhodococcus sp. UNC23MFCrub1.1 TaxID=1449068 RepID=UPI000692451D
MKRYSGGRRHVGRSRALRRTIGGAVVATTLLLSGTGFLAPSLASAVPPPPPNPSDSDIAAAGARVGDQLGRVGRLIDQVASANQQLAAIDAQVAVKREDVNKALVDLQNARTVADAAAAAVGIAQQALRDAGQMISDAQKKFDAFAVTDYVKGTGSAGVSSLLDAQGPQDVLDRAQILRMLSAKQNATLDSLQRARTEEANRDSTARQSKIEADRASAEADAKKDEAEQAIAAAVSAQQEQAAQKAAVEAQRDSASAELEQARNDAAGLEGQRDAYSQWDQQRQAEEAAAAAAAQAAQEAAVAAAARVAANQAAADRAAALVDGERDHTDLTGSTSSGTSSGGTSSGTSSSGGTSSGTSSSGGTSSGTSSSGSTSSGSTSSGSTSSGSTSSGGGRGTATKDPSLTGSAAIELVIDRGMSVLGTPYSWGGGNENGPTKGIRDGGVADSYGDYNKVGFDCSGLMMYAFGGLGISLPHYTGYQYTAGKQVPSSQMRRGDMIFYGPGASQHVALYLGDGKMLEAPQSGSVVKVSPVRFDGMTPYAVRMVE